MTLCEFWDPSLLRSTQVDFRPTLFHLTDALVPSRSLSRDHVLGILKQTTARGRHFLS